MTVSIGGGGGGGGGLLGPGGDGDVVYIRPTDQVDLTDDLGGAIQDNPILIPTVLTGAGAGATGSGLTYTQGVGLTLAGVGTAANLYSAYLAYEAAGKAEEAAEAAARLEALMTEEQVAAMKEENVRTLATARARAGASGLSGASSEIYISALEESGEADIEWLEKVGVSKYNLRIDEGTAAKYQAQTSMWGYVGQATQSAIGMYSMFD